MSQEDKVTLNQILNLVEQLSTEERGELQRKLDQDWKDKWDALTARVRERSRDLPPLSDEEIMAEVKAVRQARKGKAC
ncbi:MAG: hypothetical protein AB7W16_26370 [Candidatus Obscuribacterales bacterium]